MTHVAVNYDEGDLLEKFATIPAGSYFLHSSYANALCVKIDPVTAFRVQDPMLFNMDPHLKVRVVKSVNITYQL